MALDIGATPHSHVDHERQPRAGEGFPVGLLIAAALARDQDRAVREAAVRERNAEHGGCRESRGDAAGDLEGDAGFGERRAFLGAAPEHEGIASLEPHHDVSPARLRDHQPFDEPLRCRAPAAALAHRDHACVGARVSEHLLAHELVVQHDVRLLHILEGDRD